MSQFPAEGLQVGTEGRTAEKTGQRGSAEPEVMTHPRLCLTSALSLQPVSASEPVQEGGRPKYIRNSLLMSRRFWSRLLIAQEKAPLFKKR